MENEIVRDVYEIERLLGEGAFAEVYRVKHKFLGKQALKVIKLPGLTVEEIEEMMDEAVILSKIGHPNVIRVFDAGIITTNKGMHSFFTMEYVAGGTLETFWRSHIDKYISLNDTINIVSQICKGLSVAHSENPPIVHRDIKPQNILIGYDSTGLRVRVSDFGLAKKVNPLTLAVSAKGTLGFKPPEYLSNMDSCAGDVWAIGCILYLMLTDHMPYSGEDSTGIRDNNSLKYPLIPPSKYNIRVSAGLDAIVLKTLEIRPENRYPDATAMLDDLVKWKPSEPGAAYIKKVETDKTKNSFEIVPQISDTVVKQKLSEALKLARQAYSLNEAADMLEEVLNQSPELRKEYENQLRLWRRGIIM